MIVGFEGGTMTILDKALELGIPVFPCRLVGNDKVPTRPKSQGGNGFHDATADPQEIRELWRRWPGDLIGVPTGEVSGFDVLDIDKQHGAGPWYSENKSRLPATRIHRTRRGGLHLFFRHLDGLRNSTSRVSGGVDVRADGGYAIWWASCGYEARDYPPGGLPDWPLWILPSIMAKPVPPAPVYHPTKNLTANMRGFFGIINVVSEATPGDRNSKLFWAGCRLKELAAEGAVAITHGEACLVEAASQAGLNRAEIRSTLSSALRAVRYG
jgi:hypothetical protein